MSTRIQYAKVIVPEDAYLKADGHEDTFEMGMNTDKVIKVKEHPDLKNWYIGYACSDNWGYNYHRSWLKFVRKPKETE